MKTLAILPLLALPCFADIIVNNFGTSPFIVGSGGAIVSGSQSDSPWNGYAIQTASSFTTGSDVALSRITIPLQLIGGTNAFLLTLNRDLNGTPAGEELERWQISQAALFGDGSPFTFSGSEAVTSSGTPLLSGTLYWLVASALGPDTLGAWRVSPLAGGGSAQQTNGGGWRTGSGSLAFSAEGDPLLAPPMLTLASLSAPAIEVAHAPEPGLTVVLALALAGFIACRLLRPVRTAKPVAIKIRD